MATASALAGNAQLHAYKQHARDIADGRRGQWEMSSRQDVKALVDDVQCALADEANHELRNVLFQLSAQLELSIVKAHTGRSASDEQDLLKLRDAVDRATRIVDVFLDRAQAAQLVIPLDKTVFDIGESMRKLLRVNGFLDGRVNVEMSIQSAMIEADESRLMDVLAHLVTLFFFAATQNEHLRITLDETPDGVEGFIGLTQSHIPPTDLMTEFERPLTTDVMAIDIPYCRAVLERHGGTLYVAAGSDQANGFGFTVPATPENGA